MSTFRSLGFFTLSLVFAQSAYAQSSLLQARSSGEQVYKTVCIACHETGVANAPKYAELSLADFSRGVAYMAQAAGGNWKDPDAKLLRDIANEADKRLTGSIKEQQSMQRELRKIVKAAK